MKLVAIKSAILICIILIERFVASAITPIITTEVYMNQLNDEPFVFASYQGYEYISVVFWVCFICLFLFVFKSEIKKIISKIKEDL